MYKIILITLQDERIEKIVDVEELYYLLSDGYKSLYIENINKGEDYENYRRNK